MDVGVGETGLRSGTGEENCGGRGFSTVSRGRNVVAEAVGVVVSAVKSVTMDLGEMTRR